MTHKSKQNFLQIIKNLEETNKVFAKLGQLEGIERNNRSILRIKEILKMMTPVKQTKKNPCKTCIYQKECTALIKNSLEASELCPYLENSNKYKELLDSGRRAYAPQLAYFNMDQKQIDSSFNLN